MDATKSTQMNRAVSRPSGARGIFGNIDDRVAQVLAILITTGVFGTLGFALNAWFTSLSAGV